MILKGIKIIDLSHRLPGPLAGKILADLGAEVIKVEDKAHQDPFLSGFFSSFDTSFESWYKELNQKKKIVRLDFKSPHIRQKLYELISGAQGLILSLGPKVKKRLGLDESDLSSYPLAVVELEASSTQQKAMHDLNALALTGMLSLHVAEQNQDIVPPPFLPVAGISFGQQVATQLLAGIIQSMKEGRFTKSTCYLHDTAEALFSPFWPPTLREEKRIKFLHNGAYPCYCLYRTLDHHYVALAAVEEKFWSQLIETFSIDLPLEKRFDTSPEAFNRVSRVFARLSSSEIEEKIHNKELCLSMVRKIS